MAKKQSCCIQATPVDRISDLPDGILHHILSYLSTKTVAQISVLSKRWQHLWDSFPFFDFCQHDFCVPIIDNFDLETFIDVVDRKLESFCKYNSGIQKFRLSFSLIEPEYHSLVDKWIELVAERHIKELYLQLDVRVKKPYGLPQEIFAVKSLTVLEISCENTFFPSSIRLPYLVTLCLTSVDIYELLCFDDHKFPCVEVIRLSSCRIHGGFKISCNLLKELELNNCMRFGRIEIFAPNLSSLSYFGPLHPKCSNLSLNVPIKLKKFMLRSERSLDTYWYIRLKECLPQLQYGIETLVFSINLRNKVTFDGDEASKRCISPPYALKCLALKVFRPRLTFDLESLIDGFLWCFHPEILSVIFTITMVEPICKVLFETMDGGEDQGCCSSSKSKCWRHSFKAKHVIVKKEKGVKEQVPFSWEALSKAVCEKTYGVDFYLTW